MTKLGKMINTIVNTKWFFVATFFIFVGLYLIDAQIIGGMKYDTDAFLSLGQINGTFAWTKVTSPLFTFIMYITTFGGNFIDGLVIFQILAVSGAVAATAYLLSKMNCSRLTIVVFLAIWRIFQMHQIIVPIGLKDVLFAACLMLLCVLVCYWIFVNKNLKNPPRGNYWVAISLLAFLVAQLRNNALACVVLLFALLLIFLPKIRKQVLAAAALFGGLMIVFELLVGLILKPALPTTVGLLSVPSTQIAAVMANQNSQISEDDLNYFEKFLSRQSWSSYAPKNADAINGFFAQSDNIDQLNLTEYLSHWWSLLQSNFATYLKAYRNLEGPFFDPTMHDQQCFIDRTCWPQSYENWGDKSLYDKVDALFDYLPKHFSLMIWVIIAAAAVAVKKKYWHILVPTLGVAAYYLTFFLTAPVAYVRYVFPVYWAMIPLLTLLIVSLAKAKTGHKTTEHF
jgi:hypothetical protein